MVDINFNLRDYRYDVDNYIGKYFKIDFDEWGDYTARSTLIYTNTDEFFVMGATAGGSPNYKITPVSNLFERCITTVSGGIFVVPPDIYIETGSINGWTNYGWTSPNTYNTFKNELTSWLADSLKNERDNGKAYAEYADWCVHTHKIPSSTNSSDDHFLVVFYPGDDTEADEQIVESV